jgi:hypothetical protein
MAVVIAVITIITTLYHQNQQLAGFRPVRITSTPSGACLAIVPLDPNTNEPYPDLAGIVKPSATTPLNVQLRPGDYLVEALLPSGATPTFVDVYRTVVEPSRLSASNAQANVTSGLDSETCRFSDIDIPPKTEEPHGMVLLRISDDVRRVDSLIPKLLYVDIQQTTAAELKSTPEFSALTTSTRRGAGHIAYPAAAAWAERNHKNLPSASEYDAIVAMLKRRMKQNDLATIRLLAELTDDVPEWSTTMKPFSNVGGKAAATDLRQMHILKGFAKVAKASDMLLWPDGTLLAQRKSESPSISIRGVRSATPRFLVP